MKDSQKTAPKEKFVQPYSNREFKRLLETTTSPHARQVIKACQYGTEPKAGNKGSFRWIPGRKRKPEEVLDEARNYHKSW